MVYTVCRIITSLDYREIFQRVHNEKKNVYIFDLKQIFFILDATFSSRATRVEVEVGASTR